MSDLQPDDIVQVKTALIETYLRALTEIGGFVTPRLDANRIRASIADLKAPTRQVVPAWPALEAAPGGRLARGIGQADDGTKKSARRAPGAARCEGQTSGLQVPADVGCRFLLENKKR